MLEAGRMIITVEWKWEERREVGYVTVSVAGPPAEERLVPPPKSPAHFQQTGPARF